MPVRYIGLTGVRFAFPHTFLRVDSLHQLYHTWLFCFSGRRDERRLPRQYQTALYDRNAFDKKSCSTARPFGNLCDFSRQASGGPFAKPFPVFLLYAPREILFVKKSGSRTLRTYYMRTPGNYSRFARMQTYYRTRRNTPSFSYGDIRWILVISKLSHL